MVRTGVKFGMKLGGDKPRVITKFHDFDQSPIGRQTAQHEALFRQNIAIGIIEFVTVSMTFLHLRNAVRFMR